MYYRLPWLCLGDFNEILNHWEKEGKYRAENYRLTAFRDFVNQCSLMDLDCKGCSFTWSNRREGENLVKERLDRALCSHQCRITYPEADCTALPAIGSDHSPILLTLDQPKRRKRKQFRYEAYWSDEAESKSIVTDTWNDPAAQNLNLVEKLQQVQQKLLQWSKSKFGHAKKRITLLKEVL
ncbi:uncharacterized protein LOC120294277 [Eucalyptus grandis]|uniref:uncharacterized protein LOC120294277 n=1 Tax=Eucalyptus grandis TaxID=71139 RepID=UPI00192EA839|nr:uncharacterized protein LOC120294277 [Eucalyptus grandis]